MGQLVLMASSVVITALLARVVTPAGVGAYTLALNLTVTLSMISALGVDQAVLQQVARLAPAGEAKRAATFIRAGAMFTIASSAVAAILFIAVLGASIARQLFDSNDLAQAVAPISVWVLAASGQRYLSQAYRALHRIRESVFFGNRTRFGGILATVLVMLALVVLVIFAGQSSVTTCLWVTALSVMVASTWGFVRMARETHSHLTAGGRVLGKLVWIGIPLSVHTFCEYLTKRADIWVAGILLTDELTGLYGAAAALALLASVPLNIVNTFLAPIIGELHRKGEMRRMERYCTLTAGAALLATLAVVAMFALGGPFLLGIVYGDFYRDGWILLLILSIGEFAKVGVGSSGLVLLMAGHNKMLMWASVAGAVVAVVSGLILGHHFGLIGIALASAGSVAIQQTAKLFLVRHLIGVWVHARPLRTVAAWLQRGTRAA